MVTNGRIKADSLSDLIYMMFFLKLLKSASAPMQRDLRNDLAECGP